MLLSLNHTYHHNFISKIRVIIPLPPPSSATKQLLLIPLTSKLQQKMKKVVLKVDLHDDKIKKKVMKTASGLSGIESISVDVKEMKLVLLGEIDPVSAVSKLRKWCHTELVSVGAAEEEKKKDPEKVSLPLYDGYPLYYHMPPPLYLYS